jgi:hypothetical protein
MIGVAPPASTALHVIGGGVSPFFLGEFAQIRFYQTSRLMSWLLVCCLPTSGGRQCA